MDVGPEMNMFYYFTKKIIKMSINYLLFMNIWNHHIKTHINSVFLIIES